LALSLILESIFSFLFPVCGRFRISVLLQVAQQRAIELLVWVRLQSNASIELFVWVRVWTRPEMQG
jgi:hypothetical protein